MLVTKDIDKRIFDYIYPWGETLAYKECVMRASYHFNIRSTLGQAVLGRNMLFEIASVVDWPVATTMKQLQVDIDNVRENAKQVRHDYAIGDRVYV